MTNEITKYDEQLAKLKENVRFYISTPDRFAEALIFSKKLKAFAEEIEESVKKKGSEIMSKEDLNEIDFGKMRIQKIEPTIIEDYKVSSIFKAVKKLGLDEVVAFNLLKVNNTKLKYWVKKNQLEGEVLSVISDGKKVREKKGYIKLYEIKEKK